MKTCTLLLISGIALSYQAQGTIAWSTSFSCTTGRTSTRTRTTSSSTSTTLYDSIDSTNIDMNTLHLPPELEMMTNAFASIPDEKTRHKQLLYMATKLPTVDDSVRVPENKVPGCLSTVHVDCTVDKKDDGEEVVNYFGDSDGLLTKGLLALLIRGLSGCTPEQIAQVDPQFIQAAKISQTLTPGRNNGFLNMLAVMKKKAKDAVEKNAANNHDDHSDATANKVTNEINDNDATTNEESDTENNNNTNNHEIITSFEPIEGKPMYNAILTTLITLLKPTSITLTDNSDQHAGHAGSKGWEESGESHFALEIVAEAFEGLPLVKRHQVIYMVLGEVMNKIHALQISAKSPSEVES